MPKIGFLLVFIAAAFSAACAGTSPSPIDRHQEKTGRMDINSVLEAHEEELLAVPGVVGVYVGLLPDGKTLCLKVMVIKETESLRRTIPKSLQGYPVLIEESGVVRPMRR